MPIGRRLDAPEVNIDFDAMSRWLDQHDTLCEAPECEGNPRRAFTYHRSAWSFIFICLPHVEMVDKMGALSLAAWEKRVAEHMYEKFLVRSYAHTNIKSGLLLEESMTMREEAERELRKIELRQGQVEQRELRKAIRDSETKIGAPDDDLLVARQRQDLRARMGQPLRGERPKTAERVKMLTARLLVPIATDKKETP